MDRIDKHRRKSIQYLISFIAVGIPFFLAIMRYVKIGAGEVVMIPLAILWVMFYVNYLNLKTKVEILTELEKGRQQNEQKRSGD
jgi:hypothetical protein